MKDTTINLRQLRYFAKVVEARNITRAAEQLNVAQPALGLKIRQLEEMLGVPLLHRHSRGVDPTPAGQLLYKRAYAVFNMLEETRAEVAMFGQQACRHLVLGLTPSLVVLVGAEAVVKARVGLRNVTLSLREEPSFKLADAVGNREIDIALAYAVAERPGIHLTPVLREELLLVTRPDQAPAEETVTLEQALNREIAHGGKRDAGRCTVEAAASERGIPFKVACEMQSIAGIREMALRGMAATILPYGSVARELASGQLAVRRIVEPTLSQTLYIVRHSRKAGDRAPDDSAVLSYMDQLVDMIAEKQGPLATKLELQPS
ncbi:MAG: putative oxidative stress regulatory protein OxyR [Noviherbaspirillum sp.]|nr:putative oxidative stress regulatory protein OxyR [Noviherbaspirillum sp.]